jgi:hypothetical protein
VGRQGRHRTPRPLHLHPQVRRAAGRRPSLDRLCSSSPLVLFMSVGPVPVPCANSKMDLGGTVWLVRRLQ